MTDDLEALTLGVAAYNLSQLNYRLQINPNDDPRFASNILMAELSAAAAPAYAKDLEELGLTDELTNVQGPDAYGSYFLMISGDEDIQFAVENGIVGEWALERDLEAVALMNLAELHYRIQVTNAPGHSGIHLIAETTNSTVAGYKQDMDRAGFTDPNTKFLMPQQGCPTNVVQITGPDDIRHAINGGVLSEDQAAACMSAVKAYEAHNGIEHDPEAPGL